MMVAWSPLTSSGSHSRSRHRAPFACAVALFAAVIGVFAPVSFVYTAGQGRRTQTRRPTATATRVSSGGHDSPGVVLIRPKALGFKPDDEPETREIQPVVPRSSTQSLHFTRFAKDGFPISEIFIRFEGKTPWKRVGEVVHASGDFEEAVKCQWPLLMERSFYLSRKTRFWLPTEHPVQFGYSDENAEIVPITSGPLLEGTDPMVLREMLERSGFRGADKPRNWQHMHAKSKFICESRGGRLAKQSKMHLLDRVRNRRLEAQKWYNPHKAKQRIPQWLDPQKGLVMGMKKVKHARPKR